MVGATVRKIILLFYYFIILYWIKYQVLVIVYFESQIERALEKGGRREEEGNIKLFAG